jgi:Uma2 family endonuclease
MAVSQSKPFLDADGYLAWESEQPTKSEYIAGEVFAMEGVRRAHAIVALNVVASLREHLRGSPCIPFIADMKLHVAAADAFFYPDIMVSCDARDGQNDLLFLEHPKLIVEVLSESTAAHDRGAKFAAYRMIANLQEYVLIDIDARRVEVFRRQSAGEWLLHDYATESACRFDSVGLELGMERVFEDIELE